MATQRSPDHVASATIAQRINLGSDVITFTTESVLPGFANPTAFALDGPIDDPNNAPPLIDGDNLAVMMFLQGVQNPHWVTDPSLWAKGGQRTR